MTIELANPGTASCGAVGPFTQIAKESGEELGTIWQVEHDVPSYTPTSDMQLPGLTAASC